MMKLYYHPLSLNARKVRLAAALSHVDLDLELVDIAAGAHKSPGYLALNPNGLIPTLDDDGFVLWESNAIAQYVVSRGSAPDLFPSDPRTRADVSRWQLWDVAHWARPVQTLAFERMYRRLAGLGEPDEVAVARAIGEFHQLASVLDARLDGRDYLVGGGLTLADLSIAAGLTFATPAALPLDDHPRLRRWLASIEALDAWKATAPSMGEA
jgi:glutathione S-transferase